MQTITAQFQKTKHRSEIIKVSQGETN